MFRTSHQPPASDTLLDVVASYGAKRITAMEANPHYAIVAVALHDGSVCIAHSPKPTTSTPSPAAVTPASASPPTSPTGQKPLGRNSGEETFVAQVRSEWHSSTIAKMPQPVTQLVWSHWSAGLLLGCLLADRPPVLLRPANPSAYNSGGAGGAAGHQTQEVVWLEETLSESALCSGLSFSNQGLLACAYTSGSAVLEQARHEGTWHTRCTIAGGGVEGSGASGSSAAISSKSSGEKKKEPTTSPCVAVAWDDQGSLLAQVNEAGVLVVNTFIGGGTVKFSFQEVLCCTLGFGPKFIEWAPRMGRSFSLIVVASTESVAVLAARPKSKNELMGSSQDVSNAGKPGLKIIAKVLAQTRRENGNITAVRWNATGAALRVAQEGGAITTYSLKISRPTFHGGGMMAGGGELGRVSTPTHPTPSDPLLGAGGDRSPHGMPELQLELYDIETHAAPFHYNPSVQWKLPHTANTPTAAVGGA